MGMMRNATGRETKKRKMGLTIAWTCCLRCKIEGRWDE
jgi:hypothetical protein